MERIYSNKETQTSLWEDSYDDELPYVIKFENKEVFRTDESALAYRVYNDIVRRNMK